jgi:predicted CoA-binding protein
MANRTTIDEFLSHRKLALVRWSPAAAVMGGKIDDELAPKGYEITVVYLDESVPAPRLSEVRDTVEGAIIAVSRDKCDLAVKQALDAKIPRIWIQNGCDSKAAVASCEQAGTPVVSGSCVLMYAEPVKSVHAFHRWVAKLFGQYAK